MCVKRKENESDWGLNVCPTWSISNLFFFFKTKEEKEDGGQAGRQAGNVLLYRSVNRLNRLILSDFVTAVFMSSLLFFYSTLQLASKSRDFIQYTEFD